MPVADSAAKRTPPSRAWLHVPAKTEIHNHGRDRWLRLSPRPRRSPKLIPTSCARQKRIEDARKRADDSAHPSKKARFI